MPDIADDPNHFERPRRVTTHEQVTSQRATVREPATRYRLVDDQHARRIGSVRRSEIAAANERHAKGGEIARRDDPPIDLRPFAGRIGRRADDRESGRLIAAAQRHDIGRGRGDNARQ